MEKYTDMKSDNEWLHRIANETAETNRLLLTLMEKLCPTPPPKEKSAGSSAV